MKNISVSFLFLMFILSSAPAEDSLPQIIPLRDFFRNPETTGYELSPSGALIGFLKPVDSRMNIFVRPKSGGEAKQITQVKDRDIPGFSWKGDKYLLYVKDNGGDENFHLYVTQSDGAGTRDLTPFEGVRAEIIDDLEDHPTDLIVGLNKRNKEVFDAYRLNVETGDLKLIAENPGNIASWTTDHDGNIRVATTTDGVNTS
ncbi:MAG: S9 family peptidase, partial [Verrucomicrobia bacterium]|nr:S9 family peptidase [Verrucomicrobiota bacterium]